MTFAEALSAVVAVHPSLLWCGTRFTDDAAREFAADQEMAAEVFAVVRVGVAWHCFGGMRPTRPERHEQFFSPQPVAAMISALAAADNTRLCERWAESVRRLLAGGGGANLGDDIGRPDERPAAPIATDGRVGVRVADAGGGG